MVARDEMERMASRIDTVVARAFRIALGMPAAIATARRAESRRVRDRRYDGARECMRNRRSPMDGLR